MNKYNNFLLGFSGFDLPLPGDYVARFSFNKPGQKMPRSMLKTNTILKVLVLGDSNHCRFSLGIPSRTLVGKMTWDQVGVPEYGHMDLSHFFADSGIEVYYVAISGMRIAAPGSWTAEQVRFFLSRCHPEWRFCL